jgi:Trypsin-co-occurring domain 1
MPPKVVAYALDQSTTVRFEIDPPTGFQEAGSDKVIGDVQDALAPAIETAKLVLDKVKEIRPGEVTVTFGIKVSGKIDWFIARAAAEGNFEITLTWKPAESDVRRDPTKPDELEQAPSQ